MRDVARGAACLLAGLAVAGVGAVRAGLLDAAASPEQVGRRLIDLEAGRGSGAPCEEASDVHGHRSCREYGWWARRRPRVSLEVATVVGWIDLRGRGSVTAGGEVMAGVRAVVAEGRERFAGPVIAVRARADLWLSPRVTAGVFVDRDLLASDVAGGLSIAYHARRYGGRR